jgi:hypothetical protein
VGFRSQALHPADVFCLLPSASNLFLQLNMWCFCRVNVLVTKKGAFYHPFFIRGQKLACQHICREIFKTQQLTKISKKKSTLKNLVLSATLDAREPSIGREKRLSTSDVKEDDFWTESESFRVSTKFKDCCFGGDDVIKFRQDGHSKTL